MVVKTGAGILLAGVTGGIVLATYHDPATFLKQPPGPRIVSVLFATSALLGAVELLT